MERSSWNQQTWSRRAELHETPTGATRRRPSPETRSPIGRTHSNSFRRHRSGTSGMPRASLPRFSRTAARRLRPSPADHLATKPRAALTRTHYWFQHEPCWYVRKRMPRGSETRGEHNDLGRGIPKDDHGRIGRGEVRSSDPEAGRADAATNSQSHKAGRAGVRTLSRQWHNTRRRGDTERVCYGIELDPKYVDVFV